MKKLLAVLCAGMMLLACVGCGSTSADEPTPTPDTKISISYAQVAALENCIVSGDANATKNAMINYITNDLKFTSAPVITIETNDEVAGTILNTGNFESGSFVPETVFTITISGGPQN